MDKLIGLLTSRVLLLVLRLVQAIQRSQTEVHKLNSMVDIALLHLITEVELGHGLRNSNDAKQRSRRDVHVADFLLAFSLQLALFDVAGDDVLVE